MEQDPFKKLRESCGFTEVFQIAKTFEGYRKAQDGDSHRVVVHILDFGPERPDTRYSVRARSDNGSSADSNGAPDIGTAMAITAWQQLDQ